MKTICRHERAHRHASLGTFSTEFTLTSSDEPQSDDGLQREAITLMTLPAAKGLEFSRVYLVGLE